MYNSIYFNLTSPLIDLLKCKIYDIIVYSKTEKVNPLHYEVTPPPFLFYFYTMYKIMPMPNLTFPSIDILKWKIYDLIVYLKTENVDPFQRFTYEVTPPPPPFFFLLST